MLPMTKKAILALTGALALAASGTALAALSTGALTRLKASGLGEETIRLMIDNGYEDVDRILELKEAGFSDETIVSVIRSDLGTGGEPRRPVPQAQGMDPVPPMPPAQHVQYAQSVEPAQAVADAPVLLRAAAKVRIEQYVGLGEPVVQNSQDVPEATVSLLEGRRLKIEWGPDKSASTLGRLIWRKPFPSPFYWDLGKSDQLHRVSARDNSFTLRTGHLHAGSPATNKSQFWLVHVSSDNPDLATRIMEAMAR